MAVTYTLAITDKYSQTIFSRPSLAKNTTTNIFFDYDQQDAETGAILRKPASGNLTITITSTVATTGTWTGYVYIEEGGAPAAHQFSITFDNATSGTDTIYCRRGYLVGITSTVSDVPSPSLSPSSSESPSVSPSLSPSASLSPSSSSSPSASSSESPSVSPSASVSPSSSESASESFSLSPSTSLSPSPSLSPSSSVSFSLSPSTSVSPSLSPSSSESPSVSPSE